MLDGSLERSEIQDKVRKEVETCFMELLGENAERSVSHSLPLCVTLEDRVEMYERVYCMAERSIIDKSDAFFLIVASHRMLCRLVRQTILPDLFSYEKSVQVSSIKCLSVFLSDESILNRFDADLVQRTLDSLVSLLAQSDTEIVGYVSWLFSFQIVYRVFSDIVLGFTARFLEHSKLHLILCDDSGECFHALSALRRVSELNTNHMMEMHKTWLGFVVKNCFSPAESHRTLSLEILRISDPSAYFRLSNLDTPLYEWRLDENLVKEFPQSSAIVWGIQVHLEKSSLKSSQSQHQSSAILKRLVSLWKLIYHSKDSRVKDESIRQWKNLVSVFCSQRKKSMSLKNLQSMVNPLVSCLQTKSSLVSTKIECVMTWRFTLETVVIMKDRGLEYFHYVWDALLPLFVKVGDGVVDSILEMVVDFSKEYDDVLTCFCIERMFRYCKQIQWGSCCRIRPFLRLVEKMDKNLTEHFLSSMDPYLQSDLALLVFNMISVKRLMDFQVDDEGSSLFEQIWRSVISNSRKTSDIALLCNYLDKPATSSLLHCLQSIQPFRCDIVLGVLQTLFDANLFIPEEMGRVLSQWIPESCVHLNHQKAFALLAYRLTETIRKSHNEPKWFPHLLATFSTCEYFLLLNTQSSPITRLEYLLDCIDLPKKVPNSELFHVLSSSRNIRRQLDEFEARLIESSAHLDTFDRNSAFFGLNQNH